MLYNLPQYMVSPRFLKGTKSFWVGNGASLGVAELSMGGLGCVQDLDGDILVGIQSKVQSERRNSEDSEMLIGSHGLCRERQTEMWVHLNSRCSLCCLIHTLRTQVRVMPKVKDQAELLSSPHLSCVSGNKRRGWGGLVKPCRVGLELCSLWK